jgi:hypothetical protein
MSRTIQTTTNYYSGIHRFTTYGNGSATIPFNNLVNSTPVDVLYISSSNVGIGTTNPKKTMDIQGDLNFSGTLYQNNAPYIGSQWSSNTPQSTLYYTDGKIGIGTTIANSKLHVEGSFYATNIVSLSDLRYKTNIHRIENSLDKIKTLTGYTYTLKDDTKQEPQAGLIAQEVEKVLPEVIKGDESIMTIAYGNFTALVVESIKELSNQVQQLSLELQELKKSLPST